MPRDFFTCASLRFGPRPCGADPRFRPAADSGMDFLHQALRAGLSTASSATESRIWKDFDMKNRTLRMLTISQVAVVLLFLGLTLGNEIIDVPHYVLNDAPTSYSQRFGEIIIELSIFLVVMVVQIVVFKRLYKQIRLLEGFIPICPNCKKIRNAEARWEQMERYITQHSLAQFSHSICPDCARLLYPELYPDKS